MARLIRTSLLAFGIFSLGAVIVCAQQTSGNFRWIDFHARQDQNIVNWVSRSLLVEKWTAIREIGVVYDAALVVTADRPTPQSLPNADAFTIWNVSLTSQAVTPLLKGVNLRWFDWQRFTDGGPEELTVLYDNCNDCAATTYFTALRYDIPRRMWTARWVRGGQGVPVWNSASLSAPGIAWTQVYALMGGVGGRAVLVTWNHFDYGKQRLPSDTIFRFDVDPMTGLDRTMELTKVETKAMEESRAMELRLCRGQDVIQGLARGQDSPLCEQLLGKQPLRKPVTTPPANNRGRSAPPSVRH